MLDRCEQSHLSVEVSSRHGYGGEADPLATHSDPLDDVLVFHGLRLLSIDRQQQLSIGHPCFLCWTPGIHLPQYVNLVEE